ncbi:MAG: RNA methyltransferase [Pseudodesulfovibrio sp.]|uniref:tRNA/rRNA methyltransferase (SpoU) n=1 Tax=Pseudodesulfovibrio aespoeensis (strain ATCC 700646 / DSM 10631 / Aspo-2) TaxID=643562 RepID=E6VZC0_PSEA9|nr:MULTISPECIES: RNA methyltransferase [Pseudodesulfovibrio]MBU4190834.1 RNA methyltransferase [Pseudomonadota bacterium]ADU63992.1 tRNA/rRNA methyltransferase (SpoU) [Pseudodesulfovibrio aespoeensis Aspo-2]MBU4243865.1 RNA methyltransferase [Pseudomonadota bacterium]MBU4377508.1 RNA methyltransferase [Pseudomonadota bacterium]MBU4475395.1 RNA methyltransferase [Pseudomonadota bacterium]
MLDDLAVILFRPKYPENIGSAARACLNMGVSRLIIVAPYNLDMDKARPLATAHARHILDSARVVETLAEAVEGFTSVYGTTARTGGWRKGIMSPTTLAGVVDERLRSGGRVAILFGPEDTGLTNDETSVCSGLMTIPTSREGTSLNLAQAVVVVLYECFKRALDAPFTPNGPPTERATTVQEQEALFENLRESLLAIDFLKGDNPDYWMLPVRRFFAKINLRRNEFNLLMGVCRQIQWFVTKYGPDRK